MGHASHAYVAVAALVQSLSRGSYPLLLVVNVILFAAACVAFRRLLVAVFPDDAHRLDRAFLTGAFVVQPAFLAAVVQPGLDLPLLPEFLWATVLLLRGSYMAVAVLGTAMAFTKETGLLLYGVLVGTYAVWRFATAGGPLKHRARTLSGLFPLVVPVIAFGAYLVYRSLSSDGPLIGTAQGTGASFLEQLLVPRLDLYLINFLVITLVLNFAWIPASLIGIDAFVEMVHRLHRVRRRPTESANPRMAALIVLLCLTTAFALSRFITYGNSRYYLATIALIPIVFLVAVHRLRVPRSARLAIVGAYGIALAISNLRTVDPLSRAVYGTFPFGRHDLLRMTSLTGECCGAGQDQLAYSPEFTVLHDLVDDALHALSPGDSVAVVLPDSTSWFHIGPLDARTSRRTLRRQAVVPPRVLEVGEAIAFSGRVAPAYYLALPNGNNRKTLGRLGRVYDVGPERRFERGGYVLSTYTLSPLARAP